MTPEEAYEESLRRIREAEETGALSLAIRGFKTLTRLPPELARLTKLRSINLNGCGLRDLFPLASLTSLQELGLLFCEQHSDLSQLASLTSLRRLNLSGKQVSGLFPLASLTTLQVLILHDCERVSDLSPLAGLTSLQFLHLDGCKQLNDLSPLAGLTSLRSLSLSGGNLSPLADLISLEALYLDECVSGDLSTLGGLTSLQSLSFAGRRQLSGNLYPLAGLTSLRSLTFSECGFRQFAPLESLLSTLKELRLFGCKFDDLPTEVCGESKYENVLDKIRAHYQDLKSGQRIDAQVKVLFLGNGGVGKTQLCRRLQGKAFDEKNISSTHGIQVNDMPLSLEGFPGPARLNLWDFGGQDIYHGSHSLFLKGQAVFLVLWTPAHETGTDSDGDLTFRRRPLAYWLDYLRAFAGTIASVLIVQSQCDSARDRAKHPSAKTDDFYVRWLEVSAKTGVGFNFVKGALEEAVRDRFDRRPPPPIGAGRIAVRDRLRKMLDEDQARPAARRQHRLLERSEFDILCEQEGGISNKEALLDFLHQNGVIFYRSGLFGGRIILDQNWALDAIYSIFHRDRCLKELKRQKGRFTRELLETLVWWDAVTDAPKYTSGEQQVFLGMMKSCGICFEVQSFAEYVAPELLPEWTDPSVQRDLQGLLHDESPNSECSARFVFLHDGILRNFLSKLGQHTKDKAIYWKYGCWFYEQKTQSQALIHTDWDDSANKIGPGTVRIRAWGQGANHLTEILIQELVELPLAQPPEIIGTISLRVQAESSSASTESRLGGLNQVETIKLADLIFGKDPNEMKDFFISYTKADQAWSEWIAWTLEAAGYSTVIQAWDFLPGSNFVLEMQRAATEANRTIAVLSLKYLESTFTQPEWAAAFAQDPQGKKQKLIPVRIAECELTGLLAPIVYLDLLGLPENDARSALLGAFTPGRNKPPLAPTFPGTRTPRSPGTSPTQPAFPGATETMSPPVAETLASVAENADQGSRLSASQRLQFIRQLNGILPQQFNMLLFSVNPEPGLIPPMPAAQGDRTTALLTWAEAPGGCGLSVLQELLNTIVNPQ
jgi:internalin A